VTFYIYVGLAHFFLFFFLAHLGIACSFVTIRVINCDFVVSRHFGPKTFRHYQTGAEVSGQFGTSAKVSFGHFGTGS